MIQCDTRSPVLKDEMYFKVLVKVSFIVWDQDYCLYNRKQTLNKESQNVFVQYWFLFLMIISFKYRSYFVDTNLIRWQCSHKIGRKFDFEILEMWAKLVLCLYNVLCVLMIIPILNSVLFWLIYLQFSYIIEPFEEKYIHLHMY